ncbi:MAG: SUMF1/EgtB/PvdO family nonheme iron enzyme, partial [Pseudomonadota bacterium]
GFKTWERQVTIEAGTQTSYPPIVLAVADGDVRITSSPAGAGVTVGDEFRGTTPLTVPLAPLEPHRVELFLEGYRRAVRNVEVEPDGAAAIQVELSPIIGRIRLSVTPADAELLVDGRPRTPGSQTLALIAREHQLTVRKAGYETREMTITPRPDREQSLTIDLMTLDEAYWATRPPRTTSPAGSELKLFRPQAEFTMGAPRRQPGRRANEVERRVRLERPFYIGVREVTNEEFRRFDPGHSSRAVRNQTLDMRDQPVANISWQQAAKYCNWLSAQAGLSPFYLEENGLIAGVDVNSSGFRLPTEAEWAWAAKVTTGGDTLVFPWAEDLYPPPRVTGNYADRNASNFLNFTLPGYDDGYAVSAPVGTFPANDKGLFDMGGNVAEWVSDYFEIAASRGETPLDPLGPESGNRRVIRGASWALGSRSELRLSYRDAGTDERMDVGFRLARYVDRPGAQP